MEVYILCQRVCVSLLRLKLANVSTSIGIRKKNLRQYLVHLAYVNSIKPFFHLNVSKHNAKIIDYLCSLIIFFFKVIVFYELV